MFGLNYNYLSLFFFFALLVIYPQKIAFQKSIFLLILCVVSIWAYGIFLGLFNGYEPYNVLRNSFGLLFFFSIFIIAALKPSFEDILLVLVIAALIVLAQTFLFYLSIAKIIFTGVNVGDLQTNYAYGIIGGGEFGHRVFMSNQIIFFPIISYLLFSKSIKKNILAFMIFAFLYMLAMTRAYVLCFLFVLGLLALLKTKYKKYNIIIIITSLLTAFAIYSIFNPIFFNSIFSIVDFSGENLSNLPRREQFYWMIEYLNKNPLTGYGFGFYMPEYLRSSRVNYSYELMYVDMFLKLGIFSLILFMIYFAPLVMCLKRNPLLDKETAVVIGLVSVNIASIGNPFLFSQHNVYLIVIAYYIVLYDKKYKVHLYKGVNQRNNLLTAGS